MSEKSTRFMITILTLFTAAVHGIVLNRAMGHIDPLFTLNAIGYLALLAALLYNIPAGKQVLVHYAFMAYTAATIAAWFALNGDFSDMLGVSTKVVELLLIVFLWINLGRVKAAKR
jgi:hypothetical protein